MSSSLDPKLAENVLRKNLSNILEKVKAGKTLSKQERELFEDHAKTEAPDTLQAADISDLARRIGVSRQTFHSWKRKYPDDIPGDLSIEKWKIFAAAVGSKGNQGTALSNLARRKAEAEARKSELACEKLDLEIAQLRGEMMSREDQHAEGEAVGIIIQAAFTSLAKDLDSNISGKPPEERRAIIKALCNEKLATVIEKLTSLNPA